MDRNNSLDNTLAPNKSMFVIQSLNPMETPGR